MKIKGNKCHLFLILLFLLNSASSILGDQVKLAKTELIIENIEETYFKSIADLEVYKDFLFIVDNSYDRVLQFLIKNKKLEFIKAYGRSGQGPGDIELPLEISIWNDTLAIKDQLGVSFFNLDGSYLNRFRLFSKRISFLFWNNRIYHAYANPQKTDLIEVFSTEGERLFTFGEKKSFFNINYSFKKGMSPVLTESIILDCILLSDEEFVYCLNRRFGIVTIFTLSGERISATNIISQFGKNEESKANENSKLFLEKEFDLIAAKRSVPEIYIFRDAKIVDNYIYILVDSHNILEKKLNSYVEIKKIDKKNLKVVSTYQAPMPKDERLFMFHLGVKIDDTGTNYFVDVYSEEGFKIYKFQPMINEDKK